MKKRATLYLLCLLLAASAHAAVRQPRRDILGIRLNMSKNAAHIRLEKIGHLQREEKKRQEVWEVRDKYFSHVIVGFDEEWRVRFVTAVAHDSGQQRMRYSDVAALKRARQEGDVKINNYHYVWELEARGRSPKTIVTARGRDPEYLSTYTIKKEGQPFEDD